MYEVIGHCNEDSWESYTVDVGVVSTIEQARDLVKAYSDYQFGQMYTILQVDSYTIEQINVGATFQNGIRSRTMIETIEEPRNSWYQRGLFDMADIDILPGDDQDLLLPPSDGEWIQFQYDTSSPSGKTHAAGMYAWTTVQRKIQDRAIRMIKKIKHKC